MLLVLHRELPCVTSPQRISFRCFAKAELTFSLRCTTQLSCIPKHIIQCHLRRQREFIIPDLGIHDRPLPLIKVPNHAALEFDGRNDFDRHDGFEDDWLCVRESLAESTDGGGSESQFGGVDDVRLAVFEDKAAAGNGVASELASVERFLEPLFHVRIKQMGRWKTYLLDGWDELERNVASDHPILESSILPCLRVLFHGLDRPLHTTILTRSTSLLLVDVVELGWLGDGLSESNARFSDDAGDTVLALHTFDVDVEVELAHAGNDRL
jgi:hypothetical protein